MTATTLQGLIARLVEGLRERGYHPAQDPVSDVLGALDAAREARDVARAELAEAREDLALPRAANQAARERLAGALGTEQHGLAEMVDLAIERIVAAREDAHRTAAELDGLRADGNELRAQLAITTAEWRATERALAALRTAVTAIADSIEAAAGGRVFGSANDAYWYVADRLRTALGGPTSDQEAGQ